MANYYCSYQSWQAVTAWASGVSVSAGDFKRQSNASQGNERVFRAGGNGTTGGTEPSWNLNKGGTTSDNGITWTEVTGTETYQAPGNWAAPFARISTMDSRMGSGDVGYFANDHSETWTGNLTINANGGQGTNQYVYFESVKRDSTSHIPPQASDYAPGGFLSVTSNLSLSQAGGCVSFYHGLSGAINATGSEGNNFSLSGGMGGDARFKDCAFSMRLGGNSGYQDQSSGQLTFINCSFTFGSTSHRMNLFGICKYKNCSFAKTGVVPGLLWNSGYGGGFIHEFEACDFSAFKSGTTLFGLTNGSGKVILKDCLIDPAVTIVQPGAQYTGTVDYFIMRTAGTGVTYTEQKWNGMGVSKEDLVVVRTNGANDGTVAKSWSVTTYTTAAWVRPFDVMPMGDWTTPTGNPMTVTVEGISNTPSLLNTDDAWLEVMFLGSNANTGGTIAANTKTHRLLTGSPLATSTAAWDSLVPVRQNSASYSVGAPIKVASNAGRVFFCISGSGNTAASEPAGYANAVDGATITDGGYTFRAGWRFKLQTQITPALTSMVSIQPRIGRPSTSLWLDPKPLVA